MFHIPEKFDKCGTESLLDDQIDLDVVAIHEFGEGGADLRQTLRILRI